MLCTRRVAFMFELILQKCLSEIEELAVSESKSDSY